MLTNVREKSQFQSITSAIIAAYPNSLKYEEVTDCKQ